jgi:hypothetical protein
MEQHKNRTSGNLRDFRIDRQAKRPDSQSVPKQSIKPSLASTMRPSLAPIVAIPHRKSAAETSSALVRKTHAAEKPSGSMKEWAEPSQAPYENGEENLWKSWDDDAGVEVDLSSSLGAAPRTTNQPNNAQATLSNLSEVTPASEHEREAAMHALQSERAGKMPWAAELAFDERRAERLGIVDFTNAYRKQELLKTRTLEFMSVLQNSFREHIELFNEARRNPGLAINIYKVSKTAEDFMLFRNGVKLIVSGQRAGLVSFAFNQYVGQLFAPNQQAMTEVEASWGPFEQLYWSFKGERVQILDLVRYFMTEFVRQSFR